MVKLAVIILVICAVANAGHLIPKPRLDGRIVGGKEVDIKDFPYQISLNRGGSHICGGSLIEKRRVLTAAHCVYGGSASSYKVRIGSSEHAKGGILVQVTKITAHELYNPSTIDYDFALLELADYDASAVVSDVIELPKQDEKVKDGTDALVSGWGNTQSSSESNKNLRAVVVPVVNQEECNNAYKAYGGVTPRMICAGYTKGGKDACQGDSGGPCVAEGKLVGVVSWGYGCAQPNYPGVYSRVATVIDWIKKNSN